MIRKADSCSKYIIFLQNRAVNIKQLNLFSCSIYELKVLTKKINMTVTI